MEMTTVAIGVLCAGSVTAYTYVIPVVVGIALVTIAVVLLSQQKR